jgi:hypothetical protein
MLAQRGKEMKGFKELSIEPIDERRRRWSDAGLCYAP